MGTPLFPTHVPFQRRDFALYTAVIIHRVHIDRVTEPRKMLITTAAHFTWQLNGPGRGMVQRRVGSVDKNG